MANRMASRLRLLLLAAALPLLLWAALPMVSTGATPQEIQRQIDSKRSQIQAKKGRERVLSSDIAAFTKRIDTLQGDITVLQTRQVRLQAALDAKRAELERIQAELRRERLRLARLRARLAEARVALANRMVELYKADKPDIVTVVLNANGFEDLLERTDFMERVSAQDSRIIARVRVARAEAIATARHLDALDKKAREVARSIEGQRDEVVQVKTQLVDRQDRWRDARGGRQSMLASTQATRHELEDHVDALQKDQARIAAQLAQSAQGNAVAGPVQRGSGGLVWPASGPISSGFGYRWGRLHAGIDMPLAEGTPLRAAASGRVIIAGWVGGYGNYTCIQHSGALSTCYGHQSRLGTSVGASVGQGQVIGYSGNTGHSTGPHLHFEVRINGQPVDPMGYL
jgi:murein DD-endopeptidase MepM/ murein hydrolase activator NlpD